MTMDHERCSELLLPYLQGELDDDAARGVEGHLSACESCERERAGLAALLDTDVEPMTELERTALHRDLRSRISVPAATAAAARERLAWLPAALGVAALLLAIVIGVQLGGGAGDEDSAGDATGGGATSEDLADAGPQPVTLTLGRGAVRETSQRSEALEGAASDQAAGEEGEEETVAEEAAPESSSEPRQDFSSSSGATLSRQGDTIEDQLNAYARMSPTFVRFARSYTTDDVEPLTGSFIEQLAEEAPSGASDQVVECAQLVVSSREFPTLPAAAGHGTFRGDPSLLLGFVWSREQEGPLDNFALYVWPRGDCESPSHSQSGRIRIRDR